MGIGAVATAEGVAETANGSEALGFVIVACLEKELVEVKDFLATKHAGGYFWK